MFTIEREYRILIDVGKFAVYQTGWGGVCTLLPLSAAGRGRASCGLDRLHPLQGGWVAKVPILSFLPEGTTCQRSELPSHVWQILGEEGKGWGVGCCGSACLFLYLRGLTLGTRKRSPQGQVSDYLLRVRARLCKLETAPWVPLRVWCFGTFSHYYVLN